MQVTDEELSAFLDGELPAEASKRVAAALDEDETLRRRLQRLAFADRALASAYAAIGDSKMPAWVTALIAGDGPRPEQPDPPSRLAAPIAAGVALIVGAAFGWLIAAPKGVSDAALAGIVSPASALNEALETSPSGAEVAIFRGKKAELILTFRSGDGAWCREFTVTTPKDAAHAVACRNNGKWRVEFAASAPTSDQLDAPSEVAAFDGALQTLRPGPALSPPEEEAMLREHWPESVP